MANDGKLIFDVDFEVGDFKDALRSIQKETQKTLNETSKETEKFHKKTNVQVVTTARKTTTETEKIYKKNEDQAKKHNKNLNKDFQQAQKELVKSTATHFASIGSSLVSAFSVKNAVTSAIQIGTAFENGLAKVSTMVDTNTVDMKKWGKELVNVSNQTGIAVDEVTEATYQALSAGVKQKDVNNLLLSSNKLAIAGYTDLTTVIDTTTSILNAYNLSGEETERVHKILLQTQNKGKTTVDELGASLSNVIPTAVQMGVDLETLGASMSTLTASGIPTSQAVTKLNSLFNELGKDGTKASKALIETYEGTELAGKGFDELLKIKPLNVILSDLGRYSEKTGKKMADLFGSVEASGAAAVLGTTGFEMFTDAMTAMGEEADVVSIAYQKNLTTSQKWNMITNELKNTSLQLFDVLLPFIAELIKGIQGIMNWFAGLNPHMQEAIIIFGLISGVLMTIIPLVFSLGTAGVVASTSLLPIIGIIVLIGAVIGVAIVVIRNMVKGFDDADSKFGAFARGSINLAIGAVNLLIDGINLLVKAINLIPGVNVPLVPKINYKAVPKYSSSQREEMSARQETMSAIGLGNSPGIKYGAVPKLAKGGTVAGGSLFIAGESGREILMTDRGQTTVIPLNSSYGSTSNANNINLTFNVSGGNIDEKKLSDMVLSKLARNLRS